MFRRFVVPVLFALLAIPALADEGRIPIPFTSPGTPPIVITQPGKYILTRNLKATAAGSCIQLAVPAPAPGDVDIDLNGFILDQSPNPGAAAVSVSAGPTREVTIHDGVIQGGARGIEVLGGAGISTRKVVLERLRISNSGGDAVILAEVLNGVVRDSVIQDCGGNGINVQGATSPRQTRVERNLIRNCSMAGILIAGTNPQAVIVNNQVALIPGPVGIDIQNGTGCLVSENTVREVVGPGLACIRLVNTIGSKLFDNVVNRCATNGFLVDATSSDNLFWKNVVTQAGTGAGLNIFGDRNAVDGNVLNLSPGRGLIFQPGADNNIYRQNTARGNTGGGACVGPCGPGTDFCNGGVGNSSNNDNWLPVAPCL